jgi:hypothetical protein
MEDVGERDLFELDGVLHLHGVGIVDAFDLGGLHDDVGLDLHGAKRCGGVGGEIWIAGAGSENHDATFF